MISLLIRVLILVESGGNDWAIGDKHLQDKAYGPLQIRQSVCTDYNRTHGTNYRASDMCGNRELSKKVCKWYLTTYATKKRLGHKPTLEDYARIWDGGPTGWKKKATKPYWTKVTKEIKKQKGR